MPDTSSNPIDTMALAKCYNKYFNAAYDALTPQEKEFLRKDKESNIVPASMAIRVFARDFYQGVIQRAETEFFKTKKETPKVEIKLLDSNEIVGGDSTGTLVTK